MPTGYARILVPVDFSPSSARAVREAKRLVREDGEIVLIHVSRKLEPTLPFSATNRQVVAKLSRQAQAEARLALEEIGEKLRGVRVRTRLATGVAHERILAEAKRLGSDAIVIGAQGHTLSERLLIGSTTERVIRKARIPVIVTPALRKGSAA